MSNGTPSLSGTNLTHPASGNTEVIRDIKGAIKAVAVMGLQQVFDEGYSDYDMFQNLKISAEFPIRNVDYPCIVVLLRNLIVSQMGIDRVTRILDIMTSEGLRKLKEERRSFTATLVLYHAAMNTGGMGYLSDALADTFSFDSGNILRRYVDVNVPGIAYATGVLEFGGENQEIAPEGEFYVYSDTLSIPIYGEVIMRAWYGIVEDIEIQVAILGPGDVIIQDYPPGWDW